MNTELVSMKIIFKLLPARPKCLKPGISLKLFIYSTIFMHHILIKISSVNAYILFCVIYLHENLTVVFSICNDMQSLSKGEATEEFASGVIAIGALNSKS